MSPIIFNLRQCREKKNLNFSQNFIFILSYMLLET